MDISKYIKWCERGQRQVDFSIKRTGVTKIWCYDYKVMDGLHVKPGEDPPTTEKLKNEKCKSLMDELDSLCKKEADND